MSGSPSYCNSRVANTPIRVMALHALAYCERLFYLEEVEEIRIADERVYAGRTLHTELEEVTTFELEDHELGIVGTLAAGGPRATRSP